LSGSRFSRRILLQAVAATPAARLCASSSPLAYSVAVRPAHALLGDAVVADLSCVASADVEAVDFEDATLMLELRRMSSAREGEQVFPNRGGFQRGKVLIRTAPAGRRHLGRRERLARELDLVSLFPRSILDTGEFLLSYQIGAGTSSPRPTRLTVESGPAAIPALFKLLDYSDSGVRSRSAGLLHRMTGHVVGYAADLETGERVEAIGRWRRWWDETGQKIPWNFESEGATFGPKAHVPPARRRSPMIGGVAYQKRPLGSDGAKAVGEALVAWQQSPSDGAAALRSRTLIGDRTFRYPDEDVVLDPGAEIATMIEAALSRLAHLAGAMTPDTVSASIILATAARLPDRRFVGALYTFDQAAKASPTWHRLGSLADGLLDLLDPSRTPTGDVR